MVVTGLCSFALTVQNQLPSLLHLFPHFTLYLIPHLKLNLSSTSDRASTWNLTIIYYITMCFRRPLNSQFARGRCLIARLPCCTPNFTTANCHGLRYTRSWSSAKNSNPISQADGPRLLLLPDAEDEVVPNAAAVTLLSQLLHMIPYDLEWVLSRV